MDSAKPIFIICILLSAYSTLFAEEEPSASAISSPLLDESPVNSPTVVDEEDVPLDAWIIPKKNINASPSESFNANPSAQPSNVDVEKEAEEKRIYKALLEEYKKDSEVKRTEEKFKKESRKVQTVFKKTALTKKDQERINKIKDTQKKVVIEQRKELSNLFNTKKEEDSLIRFCVINYPIVGLPSELRKLDPKIFAAQLTTDWKNGLKAIVQAECKVVLYTGIFGKTATKSKEFLEKSIEYISKGTGSGWKMILNSPEANSIFAVLYDPKSIDVFKSEKLDGLSLRRGGPYTENAFSLAPLEIAIEKKNEAAPRRYIIISFDLRDASSPLKKPKIYHSMQMASTLLEASINRVNQNTEETTVLAGYIGETRTHPVFQILQGIMTPVDFLEGNACKLNEKEKEVFTCDNTRLEKTARTMMGLFSELPTLFKKQDRILLSKNKNKRNAEIFIAQTSLDSIKSRDNNKLLGASFDVIKGQQFEYSFLYVDLLAGKRE